MSLTAREILAPANFVSAAGISLVGAGLREGLTTRRGIGMVGLGRVFDLVDGYVARATHTSSEFGAGVDAVLDKAGVAMIVGSEIKDGLIPGHIATGIAVQNGVNAIATAMAERRNPEVDHAPSIAGKRAMFAQNLGIGLFAISGLTKKNHPTTSKTLHHLAVGCANAGIYTYGIRASREYLKRAAQ